MTTHQKEASPKSRKPRPALKVTLEVRCTTAELARRLAVLMAEAEEKREENKPDR